MFCLCHQRLGFVTNRKLYQIKQKYVNAIPDAPYNFSLGSACVRMRLPQW